jgi:MFS transporter, DHA1 family, multidrug resistance protein
MWPWGFALVMMILPLPPRRKTSSANILYRRSRRLRKPPENEKLKRDPEIAAGHTNGKRHLNDDSRPAPPSLDSTEPIRLCLSLYIALIYGLPYVWFESFVTVFTDTYNFTPGEEGRSFRGVFVGTLMVTPPFFLHLHRTQEPQFNENGEVNPRLDSSRLLSGLFVFLFACPGSD